MGKKGEKMLRHVCNKLEVEGWMFRSPFQRGMRKQTNKNRTRGQEKSRESHEINRAED